MSENKELDAALLKLETKFRTEDFLKKLGASDEAAALIASSPEQAKKFLYDGVNLKFNGSDLAAIDDPAAKTHFTDGPFKALFVVADKLNGDDHAQPDPALLASARAGNKTAYSILARDAFHGDVKALDAALADKGDSHDQVANGHDKPHDKNPFVGLRDKSGKIVPSQMRKVESLIRAVGTAKSATIAKSAGLRLDGSPIPEKFR
jgi:hypothetical protein